MRQLQTVMFFDDARDPLLDALDDHGHQERELDAVPLPLVGVGVLREDQLPAPADEGLVRAIGLGSAVLFVVGSVIGSGIFLTTGVMASAFSLTAAKSTSPTSRNPDFFDGSGTRRPTRRGRA